MKKKILFLTNARNGDPEEDVFLMKELSPYFEIIAAHPLECEQYLRSVDGVIIRNIWPTYEYAREWERIADVLRNSGLPIYNPLTGKGDNRGKRYLVDLYAAGFPVIPSVDSVEDVGKLPESEFYYIKPQESCDGFGDEKLAKAELMKRRLEDYIIQPYEGFISEPSFFFLDGEFLYAISMPNRLTQADIAPYAPTPEDLDFARKFVAWEALPYGIQRIDAVRTAKGRLLLTEDEDVAGYLYLLDMPPLQRRAIVDRIVKSMQTVFESADRS